MSRYKNKFNSNTIYKFPYGDVYIPSNRELGNILPMTIDEAIETGDWSVFFWGRNDSLNKRFTHQLGQRDKPENGRVYIDKVLTYSKVRNENEFRRKHSWLENCLRLSKDKQTTCGGSLSTRDAVIADIDKKFPGFSAVFEYCEYSGILIPTYITHHIPTNHFQISYVLKDPFACPFWGRLPGVDTTEKDQYNALVDAVNQIWDGDPNFTGCWCKNPACDHDIETLYTERYYDKQDLLDFFPTVEIAPRKVEKIKIEEEKLYKEYLGPEGSRNCYALKETISFTFKEMANGNIPSNEEAFEFAKKSEIFFINSPLNTYNKTSIETYNEIKSTAIAAKKFAIDKFNSSRYISRFDDEAREKSITTRNTKQKTETLLCFALKNNNLKIKDIAKELSIGKSTVTYNLRNFDINKLKRNLYELKSYYNRYKHLYDKDSLTDQEKNIIKNLERIEEVFKRYSCILRLSGKVCYNNKYINIDEELKELEEYTNEILYNIHNKNLRGNSA